MPKLGMEPIRRAALIDATIAEIGRAGSLDITVSQIAKELSLSVATISTHRTRILNKMKMKKLTINI